ncbi:hypothetical protein AK812_SmicGene10217 [Symbiodinium microadriaticum]|uniref:Uncharacterized protein n=1 Tax=Symbiodinium microadriaticum TaxID=2951 RepID=A0A1Q9EGC0_SYMMI|nr:hypothetical protein AK812_SmicGene10217 [Symbiodinium microadriaticum]
MEGEPLSDELLSKARSRGSRWLLDQADRGQLVPSQVGVENSAPTGVVSGENFEVWADELDKLRPQHRKLYAELVDEYRKRLPRFSAAVCQAPGAMRFRGSEKARETDVKAVDPKLCNPSRNVDNPYLKIQAFSHL